MDSIDSNHGPSSPNQPSDAAAVETTDHRILGRYILKEKSSKYRGVNMIKNKGTYEAHVYDSRCKAKHSQPIYLGRFVKEEAAARAYDLVSLKFWGADVQTNFPLSDYSWELEILKDMTEHDVLAAIRRASDSFSSDKSNYRGVVRNSDTGKWQPRKGLVKSCFFGSYDTEQEAAMAIDIAAIKQKGYLATTNFDFSCYDVEAILNSTEEPIKDKAKKKGKGKAVVKAPVALRVSLEEGTFKLERDVEGQKKKRKAKKSRLSVGNQGDKIWALETSRKDLADASDSSFQHGTSSPFCSYQQMVKRHPSRALKGATFFGFQHASSSGFRCYKQPETGESSFEI